MWIGCINKKKDNPGPRESTTEADDDHYWQRKQLKTRTGWIIFDDNEEYISFKHNCGSFISLDKNGDINIRAERHVNIKAGKSVNISAEKGDFCAEALHSFKMEAHDGDFTAEAVQGKLAISALADDLYLVSGKNIKQMADDDIKLYADDNIYFTAAKENIKSSAMRNIESYAKGQIKSHSDRETLMSSREDMAFASTKNMYQYIEKAFKSTAGDSGTIQWGKSTNIIVESGDLNISSLAGEMKLSAAQDMTLNSKKNIANYATQDFIAFADENIKTLSKSNTEMSVQESMNIQVLNNFNLTAMSDTNISGKTGLYLSSTDTVDIHAGLKIYTHTPLQLIHESGVQHLVKDLINKEQVSLWNVESKATVHHTSGTHSTRASMILLN